MSIFIERLDSLMKEHDISKTELFKQLKLGKNSYNNWVTKDTLPYGNTLVALADYFNVSIDYLAGRSDKKEL